MAVPSAEPQPLRIPLASLPGQRGRSTSLDAKIVNGWVEKQPNGDFLVGKRPAFTAAPADNYGSGIGRGIYFWNRKGKLYHVTADALRDDTPATIGTVQANGTYWFNETLGSPYWMYLSNGSVGYTLSSAGAFAQIVDPNYPATTVPGSAYLDGTLYVMDNLARIWGTAGLNNPTTWSATNMIRAQIEPDGGVAIAKQLIYVIALKDWTTEVFYDAGNPTGSPLLPVQNAKIAYGCAKGLTVQSIDDKLFWVGWTRQKSLLVLMLDKLRATVISTPAVERVLQARGVGALSNSWTVRQFGHAYYGFSVDDFSLVYDIDEGAWYYWTYQTPGAAATHIPVVGVYQSDAGIPQFQGETGGSFFYMDSEVYRDASGTLSVEIVTPNFDADVYVRKVMTKLRILADQHSAGSLDISWSDDDYKNWTPWVTVNLADVLPFLSNLGTFYRRAFRLRHSANAPFRIRALEPELMLGSI